MKDFYTWYHEEGFTLASHYPFKECLRKAYEAGTEALRVSHYKRDQELTSPYGDNNPPLPMSNPGDKDYEC